MPLDLASRTTDQDDLTLTSDIQAALPELDAALAFALAEAAMSSPGLLFVDATGARIEQLALMAAAYQPELEVLLLPAWDALPYNRIPPSPALLGQRVQALARLPRRRRRVG